MLQHFAYCYQIMYLNDFGVTLRFTLCFFKNVKEIEVQDSRGVNVYTHFQYIVTFFHLVFPFILDN